MFLGERVVVEDDRADTHHARTGHDPLAEPPQMLDRGPRIDPRAIRLLGLSA
jgi:hypothetical protein